MSVIQRYVFWRTAGASVVTTSLFSPPQPVWETSKFFFAKIFAMLICTFNFYEIVLPTNGGDENQHCEHSQHTLSTAHQVVIVVRFYRNSVLRVEAIKLTLFANNL